ncbi:MAG TPA: nitroreductase family protein [Chloroflexota bacterium]|nr:nitroreductase family protein [Chloroflexota bacterium]
MPDFERLSLPLGEAIFTQRAIRRVKPDPISDEDLRLILQAAGRAPSASNRQPWHFLVIKDPERKQRLQELFQEAWWARRHAAGIHRPEEVPPHDQAALRLTTELAQAPVLILACQTQELIPNEILAAAQNLVLAARGLDIGGTFTRLGPSVDDRLKQTFGIPPDVQVMYCIQLGYPQGKFGSAQRKPLSEIASLDRWDSPLPV